MSCVDLSWTACWNGCVYFTFIMLMSRWPLIDTPLVRMQQCCLGLHRLLVLANVGKRAGTIVVTSTSHPVHAQYGA